MTFANVEEARRFVEMRRAGAVTSFDDTPAHELVESVLEEYEAEIRGMGAIFTEQEHNLEIEAEREATESRVREEILGSPEALAGEVDVGFLLRALETRIEIDQREAVTLAVKRHDEQIARAAEHEANRKAQCKEAAAERTRKRKRLASGGGS